jgi:hypothetical protein
MPADDLGRISRLPHFISGRKNFGMPDSYS